MLWNWQDFSLPRLGQKRTDVSRNVGRRHVQDELGTIFLLVSRKSIYFWWRYEQKFNDMTFSQDGMQRLMQPMGGRGPYYNLMYVENDVRHGRNTSYYGTSKEQRDFWRSWVTWRLFGLFKIVVNSSVGNKTKTADGRWTNFVDICSVSTQILYVSSDKTYTGRQTDRQTNSHTATE